MKLSFYNIKLLKYLGMILVVSIFLGGCGFKLRHQNKLPLEIQNLMIEYQGINDDPFYLCLKQELIEVGAKLFTPQEFKNQNSTDFNIKILSMGLPYIKEQICSYDSKGQIARNQIIATIDYKILNNKHNILRNKTIKRSYTYAIEANKLLANASERIEIMEQLHHEIVQELINQLVLSKDL